MSARVQIQAPESAEAAPLRRVAAVLPAGRARDRVEGYARAIDRAPLARREAIVAAVALAEPALEHVLPGTDARRVTIVRELTNLPIDGALCARLVLGERPIDLAPGLTRAEAHAWLAAGAPDPAAAWS